jgi:hypothetical protein
MGSQNNKKKLLNESASFNMPEKKEREKSYFEDFITKLLGKVFLTKKSFFGLDEQKIAIIVTPTMKIAAVVSSPKKWASRFPQQRQDILDSDTVVNFANEYGFDITFVAPTPQLRSRLYSMFGDVMVGENISESKKRDEYEVILEELNKSSLPESIKKWAKDNPEKFIQNIEEVKKLLK